MRILLLRPPVIERDEKAITKIEILQPPIGIASIAAFLNAKGYDASVIDMYNFSWEQVSMALKENNADIFGITCLTGQHFSAFELAKRIKDVGGGSNPLVVIGGPHVNMLHREILLHVKDIDFVIREEGEMVFLELVNAIKQGAGFSGIKGLTYRDDKGGIIPEEPRAPIKDLDSLPFPDYSFFDFKENVSWNDAHIDLNEGKERPDRLHYAPIITSRGCSNKCIFCAIYMHHSIRFRSVNNVVDEIEDLHLKRGLGHFSFVDDSFCASLKRVEEICDEIMRRDLKITFTAVARVKPLSEKTLVKMKQAGCVGLNFGVESGSPKILKTIKKEVTPDEILEAFRLVKKVGIRSTALLMLGNPGEDKKTISETVRLFKVCKPDDIVISPLIILPNSEIYQMSLKEGAISPEYWFKNSSVPYYTAEYSADELRYLRVKLLLIFNLSRKKYKKALKLAVVFLGSFVIVRSNIGINRVRDILLSIRPLRAFLKGLAT